ncbi:inorganic pyrophosphatase [Polyplosphaeria fusca]|uniref:inorganic diphosphatase n=1 Tax=Polyplosphaeria fusca TaxID=682080 RepID=A0A9P4UXH1_9PLEO|nr:inorganic pyrophosphatase [Polyplosphaeria fusca]
MGIQNLIALAFFALASASPLEERAPPLPPGGPQPPGHGACSTFDYKKLGLREVGARNTLGWRVWLTLDGNPISFWHDVPLYPDLTNKQVVNYVVEIPRWTDGKIEIRRPEPLNPIFHDDRNDAPRYVESVWPHKSYPFLYGSVPQTWENPNLDHNFTGYPGDNDPMDLFDIGQDPGYIGQVKQVKVLGGLAVNDGGETDWKLIGIDMKDPLAPLVNSYEDVEKYRPGTVQAFRDWFTYYKVPRGDDVIPIIGDTYQNVSFIIDTIEESHGWWKDLVSGSEDSGKINYNQTSQAGLDSFVSCKEATKKFKLPKKEKIEPAADKPDKYKWWYYLDEEKNLVEIPSS